MTNLKLLTNAYAAGSNINNKSDFMLPSIFIFFDSNDNNILPLNSEINIEDCIDFDPNTQHKVYVDQNDKLLIKVSTDLIDTPFKITDIVNSFGFIPEYKYDEYI